MKMDFSGRQVLVVGGSSGIGRASAGAFRAAGADVTVTGTRERAENYDGLSDFGYAQLDTADRTGIFALAQKVASLDVLVNAAGMVMYGRAEFDVANFEAVLAANLTGAFQLCEALRPELATSGRGAIVNIGSVASHRGVIGQPAYSARRAGC
ncbi:MAG: SDR family NAD(P)-dependent oxidoreductase [Pacificimonas sp.]